MAGLGDRAVAGLLSALAEAPDFAAAASFLLTQLVEITGASKACMLRLDASQEAHRARRVARASSATLPPIAISDQRSVEPARRLRARRSRRSAAEAPLGRARLVSVTHGSRCRCRSRDCAARREMMARQRASRAARLAGDRTFSTHRSAARRGAGRRRRSSRERSTARRSTRSLELVTLASPIIARLASLEDVARAGRRLSAAARAPHADGRLAARPGRHHERGERHHRAEPSRRASARTRAKTIRPAGAARSS